MLVRDCDNRAVAVTNKHARQVLVEFRTLYFGSQPFRNLIDRNRGRQIARQMNEENLGCATFWIAAPAFSWH